jgi:hypothetical protein
LVGFVKSTLCQQNFTKSYHARRFGHSSYEEVLLSSEEYRNSGLTLCLVKARLSADKLNTESEFKKVVEAKEEGYSSTKEPTENAEENFIVRSFLTTADTAIILFK